LTLSPEAVLAHKTKKLSAHCSKTQFQT